MNNSNIVNRFSSSAVALVLVSGLSACNSSNDDEQVKVSELEQLQVSSDKLTPVSAEMTQTVIANGMYLRATGGYNAYNNEVVAEADLASADDSGGFSQTTTQEQGVDEADRVKYDGHRMFLASNNSGYYEFIDTAAMDSSEQQMLLEPHVRVLTRNNDASLTQSSVMSLHENAINVEDLYVYQDSLAAIYGVYQPNYQANQSSGANASSLASIDVWYPYAQSFGIKVASVADESAPQELVNYVIDGYVLDSRRIEDKMYVVSSYAPQYIMENYPQTEAEHQAFYQSLLNNEETNFLPTITAGGEVKSLVDAQQCYMPAGVSAESGYHSVVTLTTFDLLEPENYQSICVISPISGFYASTEAVYLFNSYWNGETADTSYNTVMHKFSYEQDTVTYESTGKVNGHTGWQNPHLRFSEKDDLLRVVTTDWDSSGELNHRLLVLQSDAEQQELSVVSHLPNEQNTTKIGKPGEDVYAVRYWGDKAYIVTFERIDPLYVIDLSNPLSPKIQGELEVPGVSAYLQPISDNYILGIGQQVDPNSIGGLQDNGRNASSDDIVEGAKVELYDISEPSAPRVAATLVFEHGYSPVEWDYHALTKLQINESTLRVALPVYGWLETQIAENTWSWDFYNQMVLIDVNLSAGELNRVGALQADSDYYGSWGDRAVLHGDDVYYIRNNHIWLSDWLNPDDMRGPY